ncbi:MAG: Gfo/Idh/MocA family oxidoreductase [Sphingopyxis sp.]|nr:Gfo/Idh/MocA family oxidoreductase [Sphingopyxis sp.]
MKNKMRVGIVGVGGVGKIHLDAYRSAGEIEVVAAADIADTPLRELGLEYGFTAYASYEEMLRTEALDIACVLTPASLHLEVASACAKARVAILCEKPLSSNLQDAQSLVDLCSAASVPLCYGASYRYLPAIVAARQLIAAGAIGRVRSISERYVGGSGADGQKPLSPIHYPAGEPGGTGMGLVDHGVHLLDIMPWLIGEPIVSVLGQGNRTDSPLLPEFAILHFANGAIGSLTYDDGTFATTLPVEGMFSWGSGWDLTGYVAPGRWQDQPGFIDVYGDCGAVRIYHYANKLFLNTKDGMKQVAVAGGAAPLHFAEQIDNFARTVRDGKEPAVPGEAGVEALMVLDAIYRSEGRRMVDVFLGKLARSSSIAAEQPSDSEKLA